MSLKYLVTGGSGFIGSALTHRLVSEGHHVRVLDNNSRGRARRLNSISDRIEFIEGDIRNSNTVTEATRGVDCVCHLAYVNGTEFFYSQPELVLDIAVRGMINVIDACREANVRNLVLASSSEVYQTPESVPTNESAPLIIPDITNPRYSYGGGKILCELMAMCYGRKGFDRVTIFRPHNVYGPDMGWEHVIPQLSVKATKAAKNTKKGPVTLMVQGDGSHTRAFVHIDDFIDGLMCVVNEGKHGELYHIGTQEELSISEVARIIVSCFDRDFVLEHEPEPKGGTPRRCPDISKLKKLGYKPRISFNKGVRSVVNWYAEHSEKRKQL